MVDPRTDASSQAYELAMRELDLQDDEDPIAIFVANQIGEIVSSYFLRDPREISEEALRNLNDVLHGT